MYIDCGTCPARRRACDGCMMNVLFTAPNSGDEVDSGVSRRPDVVAVADAEIVFAIDVLVASSMVAIDDAASAKRAIGPACDAAGRQGLRIVRAG